MDQIENTIEGETALSSNSTTEQTKHIILHGNNNQRNSNLLLIVKQELLSMGYIGLQPPDKNESIEIQLDIHNIRMNMYIFVYSKDNKIHLKLTLPCVAERYTAPIIGLYSSLTNKDKALSHLQYDLFNGILSFEYSYLVHPENFNSTFFRKCFKSITSEAYENYTRLDHICSGILNIKDKQACITLLECAIEKLKSKELPNHTEYGEELTSLFAFDVS